MCNAMKSRSIAKDRVCPCISCALLAVNDAVLCVGFEEGADRVKRSTKYSGRWLGRQNLGTVTIQASYLLQAAMKLAVTWMPFLVVPASDIGHLRERVRRFGHHDYFTILLLPHFLKAVDCTWGLTHCLNEYPPQSLDPHLQCISAFSTASILIGSQDGHQGVSCTHLAVLKATKR